MIFLLFIFGSIIGSFLNVVILRLPKQESLFGRSHCVNCKHQLMALDLVPLLSFIFLKGRCRYCKTKISPRYFVIEAITGLLFMLVGFIFPASNVIEWIFLFRVLFVTAIMVAVFVIDFEHYLILDEIVYPASILVLVLNFILDFFQKTNLFSIQSFFVGGIFAAAVFFLFFLLFWWGSKGRALGFGDVKLAIFLGLSFGYPLTFVGLFLAIMIGGLCASYLLITKKKQLKSQVPFGTFLTLGFMLTMLVGEKFLTWYLAFLGF